MKARVWPRPEGPHHTAVGEVLAAIRKHRYPVVLRGRRDAFLTVLLGTVLLGTLHLTREQAQTIAPDDGVVMGIVRIGGRVVSSSGDSAVCAACEVTR
jgi:hypothetical protein